MMMDDAGWYGWWIIMDGDGIWLGGICEVSETPLSILTTSFLLYIVCVGIKWTDMKYVSQIAGVVPPFFRSADPVWNL